MLLSHILWGGRFNPIIPVDNETHALQLVETFGVDAVYPIGDEPAVRAFVGGLKHLRWPSVHKTIVVPTGQLPERSFVTMLDVSHAIARLHDRHIRGLSRPRIEACVYSWDPSDPLNTVLLATLGAYPSVADIGIDYAAMVKKALLGQEEDISKDAVVPPNILTKVTPSEITQSLLEGWGSSGWQGPGLYVGDSQDFGDLVSYWNLRAANIQLYFYDMTYETRLNPLKNAWLGQLEKRVNASEPSRWERNIAVWARNKDVVNMLGSRIPNGVTCVVGDSTWNGLNVTPPTMHFKQRSVIAAVTDDEPPKTTFQLPEKPFYDGPEFMHQYAVVSLHPLVDMPSESATFSPPFIPELNEYYGRRLYYEYDKARAAHGGIDIITHVTTDSLTLRALDVSKLIQEVFGAFGIEARASQAGRVTLRLIQQMGGLQGCRVFKIVGVRRLIEEYPPNKSFTRSGAKQTIGSNDPLTGRPRYERYEGLYLEGNRDIVKWKPEHALDYLLKKQVFMPGLMFRCPRCELDFWLALDDVKSESRCEYCGAEFGVATQLKDRDWAYRRSGLFGRDDNQEGGLAVSVVLQQLHTAFMPRMLYSAGMELSAKSKQVKCETDLVVVHDGRNGRVGLVIGEVKTRGEIEAADVANLEAVADSLPENRFDVFLLFGKLSPFSPEEIERCRAAQGDGAPRVILLSDRELEPYHLYEQAEKEFAMRSSSAFRLEDMAAATVEIYFAPVPRGQVPGSGAHETKWQPE
jgi:hypothetical protein